MFSTVDSTGMRSVRLRLVLASGVEVPAVIPQSLSKEIFRAESEPTLGHLNRLAAKLLKHAWLKSEHLRPPSIGDVPETLIEGGEIYRAVSKNSEFYSKGVPIKGIVLELWRYQFESEKTKVYAAKEKEVSYPVAGP